MATELQPPDAQTSITGINIAGTSVVQPPIEPPTIAAPNPPKRQRRPSVRLGDLGGDPPYDPNPRRSNKSWRFHKHPSFAAKTSKTRPLTNLVNLANGGESDFHDSAEPVETYPDFSLPKPKLRKPSKRARTSWNKFEYGEEDENNDDEEFREFEVDGSESPLLKEQQSPVENDMGLQFWDQHRKGNRGGARVSESNGVLHNDGNSGNSREEKQSEENLGVREWLSGLGLVKYAPVFEIHEVDDDVLPILTLEDLKDMGINAVGSRRKMYSAILKLRKGFS